MKNENPSSPTHSNEFLILEKKLEVESWLENSRSVDSLVSSDNELEDEIEGVEEEEEKEDDLKYFDIFTTIEELGYHDCLLKNPRPSWEILMGVACRNFSRKEKNFFTAHGDGVRIFPDDITTPLQ
ncbi:hypothetical protein Tco_1152605 [Tanacetum coccineum]